MVLVRCTSTRSGAAGKVNIVIKLLLLFCCSAICENVQHVSKTESRVRIAIVGAGVGGASVSYFLKQLEADGKGDNIQFDIDVYEKSEKVGGRLDMVEMLGHYYETGGSVLHFKNIYAANLVKKLGLRRKFDDDHTGSSAFGILKNNQVVFHSSTSTVWTIMKILWRYGLSLNFLDYYADSLIDEISRIYNLQSEKVCFATPSEMLGELGPSLLNLTVISYRNFLKNSYYSDNVVDEMIQAITYVNYGQSVDIHALVGMVAYAGSGTKLWSVEGGNKKLPLALLRASQANLLLKSAVQSVTRLQNGKYRLAVENPSKPVKLADYDAVVIAAPMEVYPIEFINFTTNPYDSKDRKYHRTVATIVGGVLQDNFTMAKENLNAIFVSDASTFYTSISELVPVDAGSKKAEFANEESIRPENLSSSQVYKIFSPLPLSTKQLNIIFSKIDGIKVFDWYAYPHYDKIPPELPPFVLDGHNLFYVNSIEWAASAIEMSLISGNNIALLVEKNLRENTVPDSGGGFKANNNNENPKTEL